MTEHTEQHQARRLLEAGLCVLRNCLPGTPSGYGPTLPLRGHMLPTSEMEFVEASHLGLAGVIGAGLENLPAIMASDDTAPQLASEMGWVYEQIERRPLPAYVFDHLAWRRFCDELAAVTGRPVSYGVLAAPKQADQAEAFGRLRMMAMAYNLDDRAPLWRRFLRRLAEGPRGFFFALPPDVRAS